MTNSSENDADIAAAMVSMGLLAHGEKLTLVPLGGGVSCDVFRAQTESRTVCVKRALAKLRVEADWRAPPERALTEARWLRLARSVDPALAPCVLAEDATRHVFAMEYLAPETHPIWKSELARGVINPAFAAKVGTMLARIHASTAGRRDVAAEFSNASQFRALRIDPYLLHTARAHPDVASTIRDITAHIEASVIALMQGDVSPKNILCGPCGPVFIDAETANYGDPAFDLAFCLNHLLLKSVWHPEWKESYLAAFAALASSWLAGVNWEDAKSAEMRTARILPALLLARIDGKSPVEYLQRQSEKVFVRGIARAWLKNAPATLDRLRSDWHAQSLTEGPPPHGR